MQAQRSGGRRGTRCFVLGAAIVAGLWLALVASATAAPGQVGYDGCLNNDGALGCEDLPPVGGDGPLTLAMAVAVSPAADSVYVASGSSVSHFARAAPEGRLALASCVDDGGRHGCADLAPAGDDGPIAVAEGVAVSPDATSVYVASFFRSSISRFVRLVPGGQIVLGGCLSSAGTIGCGDLPPAGAGGPLGGATAVAASPDGRSVYVASFSADSVSHFFRGAPSGEIALDGCLGNVLSTPSCTPAPLDRPRGVAVSPDGRSVYVTSSAGDAITHFARTGPQGQIAFAGCLNNDGAQGCTDLPFAPLDGANGVAVSPDDRSVYVASAGSGSISHFFRGPDGGLVYDGCLATGATGGAQGCIDLPGDPLSSPTKVAVSPDGASVYVTSQGSASLSHFFRAALDGRIAYDGCLANDGTRGCGDLPFAPLAGATGVAVSPDGRSVYIASFETGSISHFFRAVGDAPPPGSVRTPGGTVGPSASTPGRARCLGQRATIVATGALTRGTRRRDVIVGRPGRDLIRGLAGVDLVCGRGGNDVLIGGAGADRLFGEGGADRLSGGAGRDLLAGGPGPDRLLGGPAIDLLRGGPGRDLLTGGPGRDRLVGGPGLDRQTQQRAGHLRPSALSRQRP